VETIAVYSEPRIKTYGFHEVTGLSIIYASCAFQNLSKLGSLLINLEEHSNDFFLVLMRNFTNDPPGLYIVLKHSREKVICRYLNDMLSRNEKKDLVIDSSAGVIYFQGPHFGDRYGIADTVFKALDKHNVPILASGCTGASMYIVFSETWIQKAKNILNTTFEIPQPS
jgi:aspartokinase